VISSVAAAAVLSKDPALTTTEVSAPSAQFVEDALILVARCSSGANGLNQGMENLKIPIYENQVLYCAVSTVCTAVLVLDDPILP